jgi:hypothetical protein
LNTLIPNPGNDRVTRPIAINEAGLILAEGVSTRNGLQRFILLIPSRSNPAPITTATVAAPVGSPSPGPVTGTRHRRAGHFVRSGRNHPFARRSLVIAGQDRGRAPRSPRAIKQNAHDTSAGHPEARS